MKKVTIKYNPYLVETEITIDGQLPKPNSSLNVGKTRIQEWIERLPQCLLEEYRDSNVEVAFTGTQADYEDVMQAFEPYKDQMDVEWTFNKTADVADVEKSIDKIFEDIQNGPVAELKDPKIVDAFQKAKNSQFEINVVATMSSGKSTLINALLGKRLMPAANEATTATIVKIIDTDSSDFSAVAYNKSGNKVKELDAVSLEDMKQLNNDDEVSMIELRGPIPFVSSSVGQMKLVMVDTPGPNNSRDKHHAEMTYEMLEDSDKSLVLYVMNAQQLGINDEKIFLDYVCTCMKNSGKQARERYIFAINKMDAFKPQEDGVDGIERALSNAKSGLEERGICNPNIFPVTAVAALEKRTEDDYAEVIVPFCKKTAKYDAFHLENYYHYSHLPQIVQQRIESWKKDAEGDDLVEIHTGIVSIEQAISQYINKYARTTKVSDLVQSFNSKLEELAAVANLEEAIRNDKSKHAELQKQIQQVKSNIASARKAMTYSKKIDEIDLTSYAEKKINDYMFGVLNRINELLRGNNYTNLVEKQLAIQQCRELEKQCKALNVQIKVHIGQILDQAYKETIQDVVYKYKQHLAELKMGVNASALAFSPLNLIADSLADLSQIVEDKTKTVDEGNYVKEAYQKRVEGGFFRQTASILTLGLIDDHTYETAYRDKWQSKLVDKVDMSEVAADYLTPIRKNLNKIREGAISHVKTETDRLKEHLKRELKNIDLLLDEKLDALSAIKVDSEAKALEIAEKERNLRWLESIQKRVNSIINF